MGLAARLPESCLGAPMSLCMASDLHYLPAHASVKLLRRWPLEPINVAASVNRIVDSVELAIKGKRGAIEACVATLLSGGHLLIEDIPGVGKTTLAKSLARALGCSFKRLQFTPDLLPSDVTGTSVFNQKTAEFDFRPGPVFAHVVLADEINRTTPKTQSALLECMEERQVTVDGVTRQLPAPFFVIATQNNLEHAGTYPLPEAQLDRFAVKVALNYLSESDETSMLRRRLERGAAEVELNEIVDAAQLLEMQEAVEQVSVHDDVLRYVVAVAAATRSHPQVVVGASPRAELDLVQLARARALLSGRDFVLPEDIKALAVPAFGHRITLRPEMWVRSLHGSDVVDQLLRRLPAPRAPERT